MSDDPFDLARFRQAQERTFATALGELRAGQKRSHWMWFIFPQLRGLGRSETARFYGVGSAAEARAYLADQTLGGRLRQATQAVLGHRGKSANAILGSPDDLKFRSSLTLFSAVSDAPEPLFAEALAAFFEGQGDQATLNLLRAGRS